MSSGLGPTKTYRTSPSVRLSSVSKICTSSLKILVVLNHVVRERPKVASPTFIAWGLLWKTSGDEILGNERKRRRLNCFIIISYKFLWFFKIFKCYQKKLLTNYNYQIINHFCHWLHLAEEEVEDSLLIQFTLPFLFEYLTFFIAFYSEEKIDVFFSECQQEQLLLQSSFSH